MANPALKAGEISKFEIFSNSSNEFIDISQLSPEIHYYENILSNSITASAKILETGGNKKFDGKTVFDGLPIRGGEKIDLIIKDSQEQSNTLSLTGERSFYVNRVKDGNNDTQKNFYTLDLCTREFFANEQSRVFKRYDGKISDHIRSILTENYTAGLKVKKNIEIDETVGNYNFIGNTRKPFYVCTWLSTKAIPNLNKNKSIGAAGGYFFYETYDGFKFKSLDILFQKTPKKYYIFNNTQETPPAPKTDSNNRATYQKILSVDIDRNIDLQQNMTLGTYNNRSIFFNQYSFDYETANYEITEQQNKVETAGKEFVFVPEIFRDSPTRIMTHMLDLGVLPQGKNAEEQLKTFKSNPTTPNFDAKNIMVQSIMRYNQLFSIKINIMIAGDFSLRAGDIIWCDFPETTNIDSKQTNKRTGGKYLIASLCHRITPKDTYTSLTLIRDSFGK